MTSLLISGYRNMDLGIFQDKDPRIKVIKEAIRQFLEREIQEGVDWLVFTGNLGFEYWALEVAQELKKTYPIQLATIMAFQTHGSQWNEDNQRLLAAFKQVDFVKYAYEDYSSPQQFRDYNRFLLSNTDACFLFYDEENQTNLKYLYEMMKNESQYRIIKLSFDDLNEVAEKIMDSGS